MRHALIAAAAAAAVLTLGAGLAVAFGSADDSQPHKHSMFAELAATDSEGEPKCPLVVAHRAGAGSAPEMTRAAFAAALPHRPDRVEVDVQLTADGEPVLVHDDDLRRTTDVETVFPGRQDDSVDSFTLE